MSRNIRLLFTIFVVFATILAGCSGESKPAADDKATGDDKAAATQKVTVILDWFPNTNHTGLYVAQEQGYYTEQGLEVEIIQPGEGSTADQLVAAGQADFGISSQEAVTQARVTNIPVVSIAPIIQHNTSAFASLKEAGINSAKDFEGKRYGGWGSPIEEAMLNALMGKAGADYSKVQNITLGATDFFKSIGHHSDFQWIFYGWDGVEAGLRGIDLNLLMLKDLDPALDYYTPVIITSEKQIAEKSDLVSKFMAATAKGYEFAIEKPGEAADILLKVVPELKPDLVKASQEWLSKKYQDDAAQWGMQKKEVWDRYAEWMYAQQLIPKMIETDKAFTNEFLPKK